MSTIAGSSGVVVFLAFVVWPVMRHCLRVWEDPNRELTPIERVWVANVIRSDFGLPPLIKVDRHLDTESSGLYLPRRAKGW